MFLEKRIVVTGILAITLCPTFLSAMYPIGERFMELIDEHDFQQAEKCLKQGANPNGCYYNPFDLEVREHDWPSLLEHYATFGSADQVEFLLEHGANPTYYSRDKSALHASIYNRVDAKKIIRLLAKKVGINYPDKMQSTILHYALSEVSYQMGGEPSFFELLLQLGVDLNHKNSEGITPLDCLLFAENSDYKIRSDSGIFPILKLLYQHGANPSKHALQDRLTEEQIAELEQARASEQCVLARRDCGYLKQPYPYPSDDQLGEDQLPYKALYNNELGEYLPLLLAPLVEICSDYSGNTLPGALLDPAYMDAEAGEQRSSY
jgi:hypothetical protein